MFKIKTLAILLIGAFILTGCYHAKITTDKNPSNNTIEKPWALGFVYGLVPPSTVETAEECPNGVSMVETKLSFLNQVVSMLSGGLVTPMNIKVTCAAEGMSDASINQERQVSEEADYETMARSLESAAYQSYLSNEPVKFSLK